MICPSLNQLCDTTVSFGVDCAHENGVIIVINEEIMSPFSSFSFVVEPLIGTRRRSRDCGHRSIETYGVTFGSMHEAADS